MTLKKCASIQLIHNLAIIELISEQNWIQLKNSLKFYRFIAWNLIFIQIILQKIMYETAAESLINDDLQTCVIVAIRDFKLMLSSWRTYGICSKFILKLKT